MKYIRRNFLCGLQGREPSGLNDLNAHLREWVWEVVNRRVHGTTHEPVATRWDVDRLSLQPLDEQPPCPYVDDELRKVARDAYVSWQGSRYSVPWAYAGRSVWVRKKEAQRRISETNIRTPKPTQPHYCRTGQLRRTKLPRRRLPPEEGHAQGPERRQRW